MQNFIVYFLFNPSRAERDYSLPAVKAYIDQHLQLFEYLPAQWKKSPLVVLGIDLLGILSADHTQSKSVRNEYTLISLVCSYQ